MVEEKDVQSDPSSEQQEPVVKETQPDHATEQVEQQTQSSEPQDVKQEDDLVRDNRPIENVAWEAKRKADEVYSAINEIKSALEQFKTGQQQSQQQPQYSKAQILEYLEKNPDLPVEHRIHWRNEIDSIEKTERRKDMEEMFNGFKQKTEAETKRVQATQFVAQTFPDCFVRGNDGSIVDWNRSHPLTQKIDEYMRMPEFRDNPNGLMGAAKMAAFDLGYSANQQLQRKVNQTNAQLRREQKKTLIAGTGVNPQEQSKTKVSKLVEEYKKTGSKDTFKELAKARGLIPNF